MNKIIFIILSLILSVEISFSIDTVSTKYCPLKVGNSWTYYFYCYAPQSSYRVKYNITSSSVINGHIYYATTWIGSPANIRVDSTNGNLLQYMTSNGCPWLNNEDLIDSLEARFHDSCHSVCSFFINYHKCVDTSLKTVFGLSKSCKAFYMNGFEHLDSIIYIKDIGLFYHSDMGNPFWRYYLLTGCVLNGIVYGDTSVTGIDKISNEIPNSFALYQNYPNPFNPTTKIKFSIPEVRGQKLEVRLVVYDILGNEVTTLVNEKLQPGTYEMEFNGSNYSSGIYFYKIEITDPESNSGLYFSETKKLILLK